MTMQNTTEKTPATKMTAIEKALAAARAKKAAREATTTAQLKSDAASLIAEEHDDGTVTFTTPSTLHEKVAKAKAKAKSSDDTDAAAAKAAKESERAAAKAAREEERAAAKAQRDAARAAKAAERAAAAAAKKSAHMSKVDRAAAKLPPLNSVAEELLSRVMAELTPERMTALALHIQHRVRVDSTKAAAGRSLAVGQQVRITGGDPKWLGRTGTVTKAARLRCFVDVGAKKPVYLFVSDVEAI